MKLVTIVVLLGIAHAQPAFEVASVKRAHGGSGWRGGCHGIDSRYGPNDASSAVPLGRCVITDARLSHLLGIAFPFRALQFLKGGPDWATFGDLRFNIEAKAEDPASATEEQLLQMLRALLIERFSLRFHRETQDVPGFALVVGKNGPKLREAAGEETVTSFSPSFKPIQGQPTTLNAQKCSMSRLADVFTQMGERPVNDETGLTSAYDFKLSWDETNGPSLVTALREQLGLRLESSKVPVSIFVIESAQKPSEN
jgi:uncharacterized protein (TIGR03435 family)